MARITPISEYQHRPENPILFEHTCCGRCGGSGMFGPLCVYNGRCFKCGGKGYLLTARGAVAQAAYAAALRKPAADVNVGDKVRVDGVPGLAGSYWLRVDEIERSTVDGGKYRIGGPDAEWIEHGPVERVNMRGMRRRPGVKAWDAEDGLEPSGYGVDASMTVRVGRDREFRRAAADAALALQATLTKAGLTPAEAAAKREARRAERNAALAARPVAATPVPADPFAGLEVNERNEARHGSQAPMDDGDMLAAIADDAALFARMLGQAE